MSGTRSRTSSALRLGGALLFLAGAVLLMGIITAEATYPGTYSTGANDISDLGGTRPPDGAVLQPSATIFDATMIVAGLLVLAASALVQRGTGRRSVSLPMAILGAAAACVGIFPGNTGNPHAISALTTFIAGGIAAITSARAASGPFRLLSVTLGAIALVTLVSYLLFEESTPIAGLGPGGVERWVAYPILLWVVGFGGYLAGRGDVG